ncbi:hypothetical protein FRB99_005928 [Tulasnella sp. 403]|nr:hypothetical protein FRB99_005928 [Tulasnella sp. 403]
MAGDVDAQDTTINDVHSASEAGLAVAVPSERELELEVLLRERDEQINKLVNDVSALRQYVSHSDRTPTTTDSPITLPPPVLDLLTPLLRSHPHSFGGSSSGAHGSSKAVPGGASATVTAALTARLAALQQENDELYEMLKRGTVGRLHEEVRELRTMAKKLEAALKESHNVISALKVELEESYHELESRGRGDPTHSKGKRHRRSRSRSHSPRNHYQQKPQTMPPRTQYASHNSKPIPTGPRAYKKPRLSSDVRPHRSSQYQQAPPPRQVSRGHLSTHDRRRSPNHYRGDTSGRHEAEPKTKLEEEDVVFNEATYPEEDYRSERGSAQSFGEPPNERGRSMSRGSAKSRSPMAASHPQTRSISRSPAAQSTREFSYSPDPPRRTGSRSRTETQSQTFSRSDSRSPARHRTQARSPSPAPVHDGVARSRSRSPKRSHSFSRSPKSFQARLPPEQASHSRTYSSPHHRPRSRSRGSRVGRTPTPPRRRSRSPPRHRQRHGDMRSPLPMRRERERMSNRSTPPPSTSTEGGATRLQRQSLSHVDRDKERDRGASNGNGTGGGGKRRRGQKNGVQSPAVFGNRLGPAPPSSGNSGTLASRIQ